MKPGPWLPDHLAEARGPGIEGRGHWTSYCRTIAGVAATQLALVSFAWVAVRGPSRACLAKPSNMGYNKTP